MTDGIKHLVELIHASPKLAVIAVAGAGGQALSCLLGVPGASRTVLEAVVPYGRRSLTEFLGYEPTQYVSTEMASDMAEAACSRALRLREGPRARCRPGLHSHHSHRQAQTWPAPVLRRCLGRFRGHYLQFGARPGPAGPARRGGCGEPSRPACAGQGLRHRP